MKRIVICADGTWNRPEKDLKKDVASNVLKLARAIKPVAEDGIAQQVFYDWGVGSYYDATVGGITGRGLQKNIMDDYRYIVQNYEDGDELYLYGFSRGAYTVRALCGLINNCGIVKRAEASLLQQAFDNYKKSSRAWAPRGEKSIAFRKAHSHALKQVHFVGVWDTVGAMGIPISFLGLFDDKDEFYDTKIGSNVSIARHALAIDEHRSDFAPTIWDKKENMDIKQVWFSGAHSDIGGGYKAKQGEACSSDYALDWMAKESNKAGLEIEDHLVKAMKMDPLSTIHNSRRSFYRIKKRFYRAINHQKTPVLIHHSVKLRWERDVNYRPENLQAYVNQEGWGTLVD